MTMRCIALVMLLTGLAAPLPAVALDEVAPAPPAAVGEVAPAQPAAVGEASPAPPAGEMLTPPPPGLEKEAEPQEPPIEEAVEEKTIADPLAPWNRLMFQFNDKFYFWVLKPVAKGYNVVVPQPARVSVRNFFANVTMPIRFVNSVLQGKMTGAGHELARFGINTTLGVAGLFDVAKDWYDIDGQKEDFGQTLGFYGMPGLMFIEWPILGPANVRDSIGMVGDMFLNPSSFLNVYEAVGVRSYEVINDTSLELGEYEELMNAAVDPYESLKDAHEEYRKKLIQK